MLPVLPRWMDTLATHPLTKKAEGELSVDVVVYYTLVLGYSAACAP